MAESSTSPRVSLLKGEVENLFGRPIRTPRDFTEAAGMIEGKTGKHISETTIRRIYKANPGYPNISNDILNILSEAIGHKHFQGFCNYIEHAGIKDSELSLGANIIKADDLTIGDSIYIAWLPDRECSLKYLGNYRFEVEEVANATIIKGDTFFCRNFIPGKCLLVDNLEHDGQCYESYTMGNINGLTCVKKL